MNVVVIITWLPFILGILTIKPNTFFSQHIHEVDSVSAHFTVQKTKAQDHIASKMFKPRFVCLPYKLKKLSISHHRKVQGSLGEGAGSAHGSGRRPL